MKTKNKICKITNRWLYEKNKVCKNRKQVIIGSYIINVRRSHIYYFHLRWSIDNNVVYRYVWWLSNWAIYKKDIENLILSVVIDKLYLSWMLKEHESCFSNLNQVSRAQFVVVEWLKRVHAVSGLWLLFIVYRDDFHLGFFLACNVCLLAVSHSCPLRDSILHHASSNSKFKLLRTL